MSIARPDHWFKNGFMLPGLALALLESPEAPADAWWWRLALAGGAACLVASSNYTLNEVLDAPQDQHHPFKQGRPVPSGLVDTRVAYAQWLLLAAAGIALALPLGRGFLLSTLALWIMGLVYNVPPVRLKEWAYLDVLSESVNNPIRLFMGWFVLIDGRLPPLTLALAYWMAGAFLMATKRFAEGRHIGNRETAAAYRHSFRQYTDDRLLVSMLFYATTSAAFAGAFVVTYHVELLLWVPAASGLFAYYLALGLRADSPAQRPEHLYRQHRFMLYVGVTAALAVALLFVRIPLLRDLGVQTAQGLPSVVLGRAMVP